MHETIECLVLFSDLRVTILDCLLEAFNFLLFCIAIRPKLLELLLTAHFDVIVRLAQFIIVLSQFG